MYNSSIYKRFIPEIIPNKLNSTQNFWFIFKNNNLLISGTKDNFYIPFLENLNRYNFNIIRKHYLGLLNNHSCYCVEVSDEDNIISNNDSFKNLKSVYKILEEDIFILAGKAIQIINWDKNTKFCGRCGSRSEIIYNQRAKKCPNCQLVVYPRISPAIITGIVKDKKILLAHAKNFENDMFSLIAGFLESGETLEECVEREILEEVGIKVKNIKYFGSQSWPFPDSLMIGFTAEYESGEIQVDNFEISEANWFDINNLPTIPSNISIARKIIDWHVKNCQY